MYDNMSAFTPMNTLTLHQRFALGPTPADESVSHVKTAQKVARKIANAYGQAFPLQSLQIFIKNLSSYRALMWRSLMDPDGNYCARTSTDLSDSDQGKGPILRV